MPILDHMAHRRAALHKEAQHWLLRLTSGAATAQDARAFEHWCGQSAAHVEAFAETRRLWENLGPATQAWLASERTRSAVEAQRAAGRPRMSRRAFLGAAVAASAALVVVHPPLQLWPSLSDMAADYRTATGEQREVDLGQGIVVQMNTQTTMNLRKSNGQVTGIDLLSGEIQIKATAPDTRPMSVFAGGGRIDVSTMGKCNVRCDDAGVQVTGLDGTTTLRYQGQTAVLKTAQRAEFGNGSVGQVMPADLEVTMAWRRRVLIFDGQSLADVVREINRYRPGKIILANDDLAARKVQARFSLNQLADVAALIQDAYGAKVTSLPGGIVILS
ncbi:FecR family protein [Dyella nitratireducens]|uniref:Sigma factor regulator VreR n=1 Tax=Dyella nitratireducens TaxID=1849580 RepID=A0ABQ1FXT3_9GAMM|nr:FecR domain-containing protein [Dyella nitratireducens]GGA31885.1 sigma factor regulator VreR [Dyella nitratireducens]GLQ42811.1 sigma factor regulator VreR [Dyella nitratireducens]